MTNLGRAFTVWS